MTSFYLLPNALASALSQPICSHGQLAEVILSASNKNVPKLQCLEAALETLPTSSFGDELSGREGGFEAFFFRTLLPDMQRWALALPDLFPTGRLPQLRSGTSGSVELTLEHTRTILACNFFNALQPSAGSGDISFLRLYTSPLPCPVAVARIQCQLAYFASVRQLPALGRLRVLRHVAGQGGITVPDWAREHEVVIGHATISTERRIEDSDAATHVDFANRDLHIGRVIPSATQEEVLFSLRPDLFVAMLVCGERMADDEAIVVSGARRYSSSAGYLDTFQFVGADKTGASEDDPPDICAIDAVVARGNNQFQLSAVRRDCSKAYLGFFAENGAPQARTSDQSPWQRRRRRAVSTGNWGCGAFGGDVALKFCQQLMAAAAAGVEVDYACFHNPALAERLQFLHSLLEGLAVAEVWKLLEKWESYCFPSAADSGGGAAGSSSSADGLLRLAATMGEQFVDAATLFRAAAEAEDEGDLTTALSKYRKAFRAWPELDSPPDERGVPSMLSRRVREVLVAEGMAGRQSETAPYLTGDFEAMKRLAKELPASDFEAFLRSELLLVQHLKSGV